MTSTSQLASVPNSTVEVPMRPYTAAVGAAAISRASARISSAAHAAVRGDGLRGEVGGQRADFVDAVDVSASPPRSGATRPSSNSTCTTANSRAASVPGRGARWRSASSAVRVRAGSMTVSLPPRLRSAFSLPGKSAAVVTLPLDTRGLAPMITRWSVRSRSGTGKATGLPNR